MKSLLVSFAFLCTAVQGCGHEKNDLKPAIAKDLVKAKEPTITTEEAEDNEERVNVLYECAFKPEFYQSSLWLSKAVECSGNVVAADGTLLPLEHAAYGPVSSKKLDLGLLGFFKLGPIAKLSVIFGAIPVGSHAGCSRQDLQFIVEVNGRIEQKNLSFTKTVSPNPEQENWVGTAEPDNFTVDNIGAYYAQASDQEMVRLIRYCEVVVQKPRL